MYKKIIHAQGLVLLSSFALAQTSFQATWTFDASALPTTTDGLPCTVFSQAYPTETLCYATQQGHTLYVPRLQGCPVDFAWSAVLGRCIYTPCQSGQVFVYSEGPLPTGANGKGVGLCQTAGPEDAVIWYSSPAASGPAPLSPADATEIPFDTSILAIPTNGLPSYVSTVEFPPTTTTLYYITASNTTLFVPATPCPFTYSWAAIEGECIYNPCPIGQWYGDSTGCQSLAPDDPGMRWSYPGYPSFVMAMATDISTSIPAAVTMGTTSSSPSTTQTSVLTSAVTVAPVSLSQSASQTSLPTTDTIMSVFETLSTLQMMTTTTSIVVVVASTSALQSTSQIITQSSGTPISSSTLPASSSVLQLPVSSSIITMTPAVNSQEVTSATVAPASASSIFSSQSAIPSTTTATTSSMTTASSQPATTAVTQYLGGAGRWATSMELATILLLAGVCAVLAL